MKYRMCMFDLDGTLLDTVGALTYCTNETLKTFGLGPLRPEQMKQIVGDGYRTQMERALKLCGDTELRCHEASLPVYMQTFSEHCTKDVIPYEGIEELLAWLKEQQILITVFSNKPHSQAVKNIETVFGKGYFDSVRGEQAGTPKKPSPEGAWEICRELGISPGECLYLGDTNTDMKTGTAAGMDTVGVTWGFRSREELESCGPQFIADVPEQIRDIITQMK